MVRLINLVMNLIERDLKHIWHPCSQMKDYWDFPPLIIKRARGSYITLNTGEKLIDAISSWWCKNLGHNHPRLKKALKRQLNAFEHVIAANTYQAPLITLSEKLATLSPGLNKVFYASEGSTAVEIAIKMSLHTRHITGDIEKTEMMALQNGYHGESVLAMSVSDLPLYKSAYESLLHPVHFLHSIPYVSSKSDPLFQDCSTLWPAIEAQLLPLAHRLSFIIFEPIVQAAGGMKLYSADFLRRLQVFANKYDIHLIADEIMTGFGRTGFSLACQHANIEPDFICLSKGLTAGFLPMSAVLAHDKFYQLCFDDYQNGKSFLHSNTFSGNALAASVALEHFRMLEEDNFYIYANVQETETLLQKHMEDVSVATGRLTNIRSIGAIVAADILRNDRDYQDSTHRTTRRTPSTPSVRSEYEQQMEVVTPNSHKHSRMGYEIYKSAVKMGAFLRPLGDTIYWTPPLNIDNKTLIKLKHITIDAILAAP